MVPGLDVMVRSPASRSGVVVGQLVADVQAIVDLQTVTAAGTGSPNPAIPGRTVRPSG